jgi:hypothetical protein
MIMSHCGALLSPNSIVAAQLTSFQSYFQTTLSASGEEIKREFAGLCSLLQQQREQVGVVYTCPSLPFPSFPFPSLQPSGASCFRYCTFSLLQSDGCDEGSDRFLH